MDAALAAAEEGLELFPDAERLLHVRAFAKKDRCSGVVRKLKDDVAKRPNPATYAQLAQTYRELGDAQAALEVAAECAEKYPLSEASFLVTGEIRAERFRRDLVAKDALLAVDALTKVVRLNPRNAAAHVRLAEVRWLVGDAPNCREHLRLALDVEPALADVAEFLASLDASPAADDAPTIDVLAETVESNRAFANDPSRFPDPATRAAATQAFPAPRVDVERVRESIAALGREPGVRNAVVLDKSGARVAEFSGEGALAPARFVELVDDVRGVADEAGRRLDAGSLVRFEIEGPCGNVSVATARGHVVAILFSAPFRMDRAGDALSDVVSPALARGWEDARA